jgi:hypothetical protein
MSETVELTEADITAIIEAFQKPDRTVAMFQAATRIKAAARREALLEAADAETEWGIRHNYPNGFIGDDEHITGHDSERRARESMTIHDTCGARLVSRRIGPWVEEIAEPERDEGGR